MNGPGQRSRTASWLLLATAGLVSFATTVQARHFALVVGGLGGEPEYEQRFEAESKQIADSARRASDDADVTLLNGAAATRDAVHVVLLDWTKRIHATDQFTITLVGHGSFDGEEYRFNIPGLDITASDLRAWLAGLPAQRQLLVIATSASGAALERLQSAHRIVITATKSGNERNATRFGEYWAQALQSGEADRDKNEWVTVLEAFQFATRNVAEYFKSNAALATEHARLDGVHAESFALGRLGNLPELPSDPQLIALFAERARAENEFDAVKARKKDLPVDEYYARLEKTLVALAKTQRKIDARQAGLQKGGKP